MKAHRVKGRRRASVAMVKKDLAEKCPPEISRAGLDQRVSQRIT